MTLEGGRPTSDVDRLVRARYIEPVMLRCWRLIALGVAGGLVLAFTSASSAEPLLFPIELTASGPVPATLTLVDGQAQFPVWQNSDTVTHTVTFSDGLCSIQIPPGATMGCPNSWDVGRYSYTEDGTSQASIAYTPDPRTVTLWPTSRTIERGAHLELRGLLSYGTEATNLPGVGTYFTFMPVMVLARHNRHQPFRQIANAATGGLAFRNGDTDSWPWRLGLRPRATTTYIAEVDYQPDSGQIWQNAVSKPFKVVVHTKH
jgi:hypothetical protein